MDSPPPAPGSSQTKKIFIWLIIAAAGLFVGIVAIISSNKPAPESALVWLDQKQFWRQMQPGQLKRLYYKVVHFTAPVWQRFRRPKTNILIGVKILAVHGVSTGELGIGAAMATNETGTQVWILSPSELDDMRQRLKTANGIEVVNSPSLTVADGTSASIIVGTVTPVAAIGIGNPNRQPTAFVGVNVGVNPKIVSHQFQFAMSAVYSEPNQGSFMDPIQTNICAACRVRLSNAGGVLISGPVSKDLNGTNYWLILALTAIDGYGKPIKL